MPDNQDFFSPAYMDEHLEPSASSHVVDDPSSSLLVHDLHALYSRAGAEQRYALQRVWERLEAEHTRRHAGEQDAERAAEGRLYALKPRAEIAPVAKRVRRSHKRQPHPGLAALAALLFLVIMVGSLLTIVHFTRIQFGTSPITTSTPAQSQSTPTPIPGYAYPVPGRTVSVSQTSPASFSGLTWSQDSKQVAASTQGKVWIWNILASGPPLIFDPHMSNVSAVLAWSPGAPRLAVGSSQVQVIDPGNGVAHFHYPALSSYAEYDGLARVTALAWSPDGKQLAVATHDPTSGNTVRIWNVNAGLLLYTYTGQRSGTEISSISWSSDGRYIASSNGQSVQAWNATNGQVPWQTHISAPTNVAWSPGASNPGFLAFANGKRTEVWNIWANTLVSRSPVSTAGVLAWSPDGHDLASANGNAIVIWDVNKGLPLYTYTGHTHPVVTVAWSQDGQYMASGEDNASGVSSVRVWIA
jgi:WD40 repeat protein